MPGSPLASTPYAVLGVPAHASDAELRAAYRRRLRETHPDTGGRAADFHAVQRAWEQVGTPEARAAYDSGRAPVETEHTWAPAAPRKRANTSRPQARIHGHPGGWYREQYLDLLQEWMGRGAAIPDPYDPALVRRAPGEVRYLLANAIAEEQTAVVLAGLGIGFTVWHDVKVDSGRDGKIDHVVLGPTGLWALLSEDWGAPVSTKRGDLTGAGLLPGERPLHELAGMARQLERQAQVRFSALGIVVADDASPEGVMTLGTIRGAQTLLVQRPRLAHLLQTRGGASFGGSDQFEVRTRVQSAVRFV